MSDVDLWGRTSSDPARLRGYCRSCREWVEPEPVAFEEGTEIPALWVLLDDCPRPGCGSPLLFPDEQPRCKHYRCSRFVASRGDYCGKHARKPKPMRPTRCGYCGRFLRRQPRGRWRRFCPEPRWCRKRAQRG